MPIPRLHPASTVLLVVDIQERFATTVERFDRVVENGAILARMAGHLGIPVVVTEQYPARLGATVAAVKEALPPGSHCLEKTRFSSLVPQVAALLASAHRANVLVCGIEAHVCVLQTVLDLVAAGYQAFHVTDAISASQLGQVEPAFRRMERAGSLPTGVLSCMYELLGDSTNPAFKRCLDLAKAIRQ